MPEGGEPVEIRTDHLVLRAWRDSDHAPFAELTADPVVMQHFPALLSREESGRLARYFAQGIRERGWGMWAVERRDTGDFAGYVGLAPVTFDSWFTPAVEIGWRLARSQWGQGVATEAARASLGYAFDTLRLTEVVAFTVPANSRSLAVMGRLGMAMAGDFDHPRMPEGHHLRHHVLYRATPPSAP